MADKITLKQPLKTPANNTAFQRLTSVKLSEESIRTATTPRTQVLVAAVSSISDASRSIRGLGKEKPEKTEKSKSVEEVKEAVDEASRVEVRDVEKAAELAQSLLDRINLFEEEALAAQAVRISPDVVFSLLE